MVLCHKKMSFHSGILPTIVVGYRDIMLQDGELSWHIVTFNYIDNVVAIASGDTSGSF